MTCTDVDLLIAARAVGALDPAELTPLEEHLGHCERCRRAAADYASVAALLPLALEPRTPPASLRTQLMARIYAEAATPARRPTLRQRVEHLLRRVPASRTLTVAAAGTAAVALGLFGWSLAGRSTAPASLAIHFGGTPEAPAVQGTLTYDAGARQTVLDVEGLSRAALASATAGGPGVYEVWLIRSDGSVVAAAYLTLSPDDRSWTAAIPGDLGQYTAVATTIEPGGGSRTPSGPEVIHIVLPGRSA